MVKKLWEHKIKSTLCGVITGLLCLSASNVCAQDLLASHAPSDKHMLDLKNITINKSFADRNNFKIEWSNIYTNWDNSAVSKVTGILPANFKVDLRGFCMPTPSRTITSNYGPRWGRIHRGIDIKVYTGDTIYAAFDGKVRVVKYDPRGYGYYVLIRHPNGLETLYGHLSRQLVIDDEIVRAGQPIGLGGNTGRSTGSHLHFETRLLGEAINPAYMFDFEHQDVTGDYYVASTGSIIKISQDATEEDRATMQSYVEKGIISEEQLNDAYVVRSAQSFVKNNTKSSSKSRSWSKNRKATTKYTIKDGDSLYKIAKKYNTTVDKLRSKNKLGKNAVLHKGQKLSI